MDTLTQLELFEAWVDGAQDVDPREKELSELWRELLIEISRGARPKRLLLETLRKLDGETASVLLSLHSNSRFRPRDSRELYHLRILSQLELVDMREHVWLAGLPVIGMVCMGVAVRLVSPNIFAGINSMGDALRFMSGAMPFIVVPMLGLAGLALWLANRIPKWRLSWLGMDLVAYARPVRKMESPNDESREFH